MRFFAGHPTAANLLMIAFLVIGAFSWPQLLRSTFPRITPSQVQVSVVYRGARAEDVKEAICRRIEDAISNVNQVEEVICEALEGRATAVVKMEEGGSLDRFTAEITTEIDAITDFPENAEKAIIKQLGRTDFVAAVAITGPRSKPDLKAYAEQVKARMLQWGGITKVEIKGFSDHQIRIEIGDRVLRQFRLSTADIANKIKRQSLDLPAGSLLTRDREILVRFADERKRVREFLELVVVASKGGGQVRLGEIARITNRFELDEDKIVFNGKPAAVLEISKSEKEDTLRAISTVRAFLAHERKTAPPSISLTITRDGSSIVRDRINMVVNNMGQGLILVVIMIWLVFGFRYSLWVAMGLPVSFAGAVGLMVVIGYTINVLTLVGALITVGLLMDDAIVIAENIASHRQRGKSALEAAVDGVRQVVPSVFASFITTAFIFGSLMFLQGDLGQVLRVVPAVMLMVLTISLIEAFLILPHHLAHSIEKSQFGAGRVQQWVGRRLDYLRERIAGPAVDRCIAWRYVTLGAAIGLLLLSVSLLAGGVLKFRAFPEIDGDTLEARILLPQGTPLTRTEAVVARIEVAIRQVDAKLTPLQPKRQSLVRGITVTYNKNTDASESGAHVATITADLLSAEVRTLSADEVLNAWRKEAGNPPDVISVKYVQTVLGPGGLPINLRLLGNDLARLKKASLELQTWFNRYRGVHSITDDLRPGKPEIRIRLKDGATTLGIDARMIADQLRAAFLGKTVSEIQVGPETLEIDVRLGRSDRDSLADLEQFTIATSAGARIPITAVAVLEAGRGYARINRVNGLTAVTIQGEVNTRIANASAIVNDTLARFMPGLLKRYPGIKFGVEGQNKEAGETQGSMARGLMIGLIGVFIMLSFQFRSYVEPIVVMLAIPLALIGVIVGHVVMGLDVSMPSMLGFAALAGVVVNDSILLVNFIKMRHGEGVPILRAASEASRARFRAIFLTSVTTLAGLLPMLTETSLQAQVLIPLVTSLIFGLLASTVLVLLVVPTLYVTLDDLGLTTLARDRGRPAAQPA